MRAGDEVKLVRCMLGKYAERGCRKKKEGAEQRKASIEKVFAGRETEPFKVPDAASIAGRSTRWGSHAQPLTGAAAHQAEEEAEPAPEGE